MRLSIQANAKVNLLLDLTSVYPDGYHGIYTVMQSVGLADTIHFEKTESEIHLRCSDESIPTDEKNTAMRAAQLFFEENKLHGGINIFIEKKIPTQAGMGGGSADAAAVIEGLNHLYQTNLSLEAKKKIARKIGADVPFCLVGGTALCLNIGDLIAPLPPLPAYTIVLAKPKAGSSTKEAYKAYDSLRSVRHPNGEMAVNAYLSGDYKRFFALAANVFEQAIDVPGRAEIKAVMRAFGCEFSLMTGSGSVIYGVFSDSEVAARCAEALIRGGRDAILAPASQTGLIVE